MWMEEKIGRRINVVRVEQALPQRPRVIATACPYCATMMADGVKALAGDSDIATRDIAELVAEALVEEQPSPIAAARAV
jgi:Fe-S oxidoreductase